jgi:phosphatidylglycerophosphate synthase
MNLALLVLYPEVGGTSMSGTPRLLAMLPNALSVCRIILGLSFPWTPTDWRVAVLVVAALTDLFDGVSSRLFQAASPAGRLLDPIADKVFVFMVVITLLVEKSLVIWDVVLVGSRDLVVLAGIAWCLFTREWSVLGRVKPSLWGKLATAAQFLFILIVLLRQQRDPAVLLVTAALSGLAAVHYLWLYLRRSVT